MPRKKSKVKEQNLFSKIFIPEVQAQLKQISGIDVRNCISENNYKTFWEMVNKCYPPAEIRDNYGKIMKIKKIPKKTSFDGITLNSLKELVVSKVKEKIPSFYKMVQENIEAEKRHLQELNSKRMEHELNQQNQSHSSEPLEAHNLAMTPNNTQLQFIGGIACTPGAMENTTKAFREWLSQKDELSQEPLFSKQKIINTPLGKRIADCLQLEPKSKKLKFEDDESSSSDEEIIEEQDLESSTLFNIKISEQQIFIYYSKNISEIIRIKRIQNCRGI
jgi:hypothetical protein